VVPRERLPIRFSLNGRPLAGETLCIEAGATVLVLTSCSAELGIELRSAYLGGEGCSEALVAESAVLASGPVELLTRRLATADAHTDQHRHLLYDHLQRLQDLAERAGHALAFEGLDASASHLDPLSPAS